ncbi:MAG: phosphate ABC transporter substrate-binding protein, partial [Rhodospirillales bacterium 12-54-5]
MLRGMMLRRIILAMVLLLPLAVQAREQIRATGSNTVFPFVAAAAEQFGREGKFRTPIVEATGTGGGFKSFCSGVGEAFPDISDASRAIKPSETELCHKHGVDRITELKIGYDGIVLANTRTSPQFKLTRKELFLALAREVPLNGKLVQNPYKNWREINPKLPDLPIMIYGSPPTSGTRDAFVELAMDIGCKQTPEYAVAYPDETIRKHQCGYFREDGAFIEEGENGNLIIQKLLHNEAALGIFGYSFLEQNESKVQASTMEGITPTFATITDGTYTLARPLYIYVKQAHITRIPGLKEFVREIFSDAA